MGDLRKLLEDQFLSMLAYVAERNARRTGSDKRRELRLLKQTGESSVVRRSRSVQHSLSSMMNGRVGDHSYRCDEEIEYEA
jgi:hypothetical protein